MSFPITGVDDVHGNITVAFFVSDTLEDQNCSRHVEFFAKVS